MRKKQLLSDDSLQVPLWRYFGIAFAISFAPMLGSSGTGWISAFEQSREFSSLAFLVYYAIAALALLCALHLKGDRIPVKPLYIGISLAATIGICLLCLTGLKIIDARFYLLGTIAVSLSMIPLVLAWGRIFKTLNANTMRICVSGSFLVAWILHLALNEISRLMPLFATALLLLLPWVSLWLLYSVQGARQDTGHPSPDKAKHLHMPAHMLGGILVYGVVFGFIVNLTTHSSTITANAGIVQSLLIGCVAASLFLAAIFSNNLNSRLMYRPVLPLVVVGFLLVPILGFGSLDFANAIVIAGFSYFRIFWVIVCFDIVRGTGATVEKTFGWGLLADYGGAVLGAFCYYLFSVNLVFTDLQLMIISTVVVVTLILTSMLLLNERNFDDLWGMSPQASQNFKMACREIALIHRLTPREEEILILLARGRNREFIQRTFTLSKFTVKTHIQRIYEKLNVHSHQELISLVEKLDQSIFS